MKYVVGDRVAKSARLVIGCSAVVLDEAREAVLLIRRTDNDRWCLPAGAMEPGESPEEAAIRETKEESGFDIAVLRLLGVYSSPHVISEYADGNRYQVLGVCFEARITGGEARTSDESSEVEFLPLERLESIDLVEPHRALIAHLRSGLTDPFFRYIPPGAEPYVAADQ